VKIVLPKIKGVHMWPVRITIAAVEIQQFNIHGTVHRNMTSSNYQQDATQLRNLLFHIRQ
jgi:phage baseplate assembly protein W